MTLEEVLPTLSSAEQASIKATLQNLAASSALTLQAVQNLNTESRLTEDCWRFLVQKLAGAADARAQQQAITGAKPANGSTISGVDGVAGLLCTRVLGR